MWQNRFDILGRFPLTNSGNKYFIPVMDYFSKWSEAVVIFNKEATKSRKHFLEMLLCGTLYLYYFILIKDATSIQNLGKKSWLCWEQYQNNFIPIWWNGWKHNRTITNYSVLFLKTITKEINVLIYRLQRTPRSKPKVI